MAVVNGPAGVRSVAAALIFRVVLFSLSILSGNMRAKKWQDIFGFLHLAPTLQLMAETNSMSRRPTGDPRNKYRRSSDYEEQLPYPTSSPFSHKSPARRRFLWFFSRLTLKRTLVLVPCLILFAFLWSGIPPSYDHIRVYEQNLPQHHHSPMPSNSQNFLRFEGMIWGHGLNNVLQET